MILLLILFVLLLPIEGHELCSSQKFTRKLYFLHWRKCMEVIPLGWETVSTFSLPMKTKTNCSVRSIWVQNFEVSHSEIRYFPLHISNESLLIAILCLFLKLNLAGPLSNKSQFKLIFHYDKWYMIIFSIYRNKITGIVTILLVPSAPIPEVPATLSLVYILPDLFSCIYLQAYL